VEKCVIICEFTGVTVYICVKYFQIRLPGECFWVLPRVKNSGGAAIFASKNDRKETDVRRPFRRNLYLLEAQ